MKTMRNIALALIMFMSIFSVTVLADTGPKPSVVLNFEGLEDQTFYITLLSQKESTGPYSVSDEPIDPEGSPEWDPLRNEAWQAFRDYKDEDGFYFIEYFDNNEDNRFDWGYYPPDVFKVLIYFPESHSYKVSGICERYAFDSYFSVKLDEQVINEENSELEVLKVEKHYDYTGEIVAFVARVMVTVILELFVALCFGIRKKKLLLLIAATNVFTQSLLNSLLLGSHYGQGSFSYLFYYFWLEVAVFVIEAGIFTKLFKKNGIHKGWLPVVYALIANAFSFGGGLLLSDIIPGIF